MICDKLPIFSDQFKAKFDGSKVYEINKGKNNCFYIFL